MQASICHLQPGLPPLQLEKQQSRKRAGHGDNAALTSWTPPSPSTPQDSLPPTQALIQQRHELAANPQARLAHAYPCVVHRA